MFKKCKEKFTVPQYRHQSINICIYFIQLHRPKPQLYVLCSVCMILLQLYNHLHYTAMSSEWFIIDCCLSLKENCSKQVSNFCELL